MQMNYSLQVIVFKNVFVTTYKKFTHSSTLAWRTPWMEEPGRLQSMGSRSQTRLNDFTFTFHFHALEKEMATHSSVLAWRIPGMGEPGWLPSLGSHRVRHDWSDLATAATATHIPWHAAPSIFRAPHASNLQIPLFLLTGKNHSDFKGLVWLD